MKTPKQIECRAKNVGEFPLTLTLSQREREQQSELSRVFNARPANTFTRFFVRLNTILPLPKGEGWGEGKGDMLFFQIHEFNF
ncbi:MAG TPA: hypothetical protein VN516_02515 [Candidatus Baltobacteraceae bacterium]|nr:hypothetical protein [Candidatus Baltobacteraceae bacterium]